MYIKKLKDKTVKKILFVTLSNIGDVILFPNYLMHTAYPFSAEGERRSFSFNVEIDSDIANVFKK